MAAARDDIEALRAGEEINYEGVTGSMEYTDSGVLSGRFGVFEWTDPETLSQVATVDGAGH